MNFGMEILFEKICFWVFSKKQKGFFKLGDLSSFFHIRFLIYFNFYIVTGKKGRNWTRETNRPRRGPRWVYISSCESYIKTNLIQEVLHRRAQEIKWYENSSGLNERRATTSKNWENNAQEMAPTNNRICNILGAKQRKNSLF